jgi:hypothetical protein
MHRHCVCGSAVEQTTSYWPSIYFAKQLSLPGLPQLANGNIWPKHTPQAADPAILSRRRADTHLVEAALSRR